VTAAGFVPRFRLFLAVDEIKPIVAPLFREATGNG
jgi:hypothetical protein